VAATALTATVTAQAQVGFGASTTASTQAVAPSTLNLPASFLASTTNGRITFGPDALGASPVNIRTVVLRVSGGTLTAVADSTVALSENVTSTSITLTGTERALSDYLGANDKLTLSGLAADYTLTVTAQSANGGVVQSATTNTATLSAQPPVSYGRVGARVHGRNAR
jgi:hypothetical protein